MKRWRLPLVIGSVALVALAAAFGATRAGAATTMHRSSPTGGTVGAGCDRLMNDPAAAEAMQPLHAEHVKDMQAWRDRYGASRGSAEAQTALRQMSREHGREMRAAFKKLGIRIPAGACDPGTMGSAGMMDGRAAGMMDGGGAGSDLHQQHHAGDAGTTAGGASMMGASSGGMMGGASY